MHDDDDRSIDQASTAATSMTMRLLWTETIHDDDDDDWSPASAATMARGRVIFWGVCWNRQTRSGRRSIKTRTARTA